MCSGLDQLEKKDILYEKLIIEFMEDLCCLHLHQFIFLVLIFHYFSNLNFGAKSRCIA